MDKTARKKDVNTFGKRKNFGIQQLENSRGYGSRVGAQVIKGARIRTAEN